MSGLVKLDTYSTPPSILAYDQFRVGGSSPSIVLQTFVLVSMEVLVFLDSVSPQACAILVIASSWLSCNHLVPLEYSPRSTHV